MTVSKLAWHFQNVPAWAAGVVNSGWVKVIDPPSTDLFPAAKTIGRVYIPDDETNAMIWRGAPGAAEWCRRCEPSWLRAPWVHAWELPNEPQPMADVNFRRALCDFTHYAVGYMQAFGLRSVALCLGVGWPDVGQAGDLKACLARTDYWALHEYSAPTLQNDQSWLCLRYRRTVQELMAVGARIPPLLITECGLDGGVIDQRGKGWRSYTDQAGYLQQLAWYDAELAKDEYVRAATIFTSGPNDDWRDFDVDEALSRDLAGYICSQREQVPAPQPTPAPTPGPTCAGLHVQLARPLSIVAYPEVSQWFGENPGQYAKFGLAGHNGIDYPCDIGAPVVAAHTGIVEAVGYEPNGFGHYVKLGTDAYLTLYAHLSRVDVVKGQPVTRLAPLAAAGSSGFSTGPHLHFGLRLKKGRNDAYGHWWDPVPFRTV